MAKERKVPPAIRIPTRHSKLAASGDPTPEALRQKKKLAFRAQRNTQKDSLANVGIEPKTFALLARRSNQLS